MKPSTQWKQLIKKALEIPKSNYFEFSGDSLQLWSQLKRAAVLALFVEKTSDESPNLVFTKRSVHMNSHRGQMSFPGGGFDLKQDRDLVSCALRETEEEIGVASDLIEVLGEFEDIITTSRYWLTPVVGWSSKPLQYRLNPIEVDKLVEIPVKWLWDRRHYGFRLTDFYRDGRLFDTYFFPPYEGEVVWGATASLILRLFSRIEGVLKNDPSFSDLLTI